MVENHIQIDVEEESRIPCEPTTTPLLKDQERDDLDKTLQRLDLFLLFLGFNQSSPCKMFISWGVFLGIGVVMPVVVLELSKCPGCEKGQIKSFEIGMVVSQACLASVSLICVSHNLRKYGVRKFLFVDRYSGHMERFTAQYVQKISDSFRLLVLWVLPGFILKTAREIIRIMYVHHESWWQSAAIFFTFVFSWTYVTIIIVSACVVFYVVCNLQVIHFDDYGKVLESECDVIGLLQEHARLRYYLSKISHRFRMYLLSQFVIVTISQFVTLFQTTGYNGIITFINGGDFAATSVVQVGSIILCLNAAAKISHRAQGIGAIASKWHASVTCNAVSSSPSSSMSSQSFESSKFHTDNSESDLESLDFMTVPTNSHLASYMSQYHKRLALVMYLQANPGGITIFGWRVDRGLIDTIFFIQLSLVTFVLGKTIVVSPEL